jgi:Uma2 family endonuclease
MATVIDAHNPDGLEPVRVPDKALTLTGFRAWAASEEFPRRGRISFINERLLIDISPEEIETHNKVKTAVGIAVPGFIARHDLGTYYSDRTLLTNVRANLSTEPDGMFACWESFDRHRVELVPRRGHDGHFIELKGTPDWVVEVVSLGSRNKDRVMLREAYHAAGIPEYWLIDASGDPLDFQLLVHERSGYVPAEPTGGWRRSPVFGRLVRLDRVRDRLGLWKYTLRFKSA